MKKPIKIIFSTPILFLCLIIVQISLFIAFTMIFSKFGTFAYLLITICAVFGILAIQERTSINPAYKIMWMLIALLLPFCGILFYYFWGKRSFKPKGAVHLIEIERGASCAMRYDAQVFAQLTKEYPKFQPLADYLANHANAPVYEAEETEYFAMGEIFYPVFLQELEKAKHSIYLEYFIIEEGKMWEGILNILKQKAAAGVDVRIIFDSMGSLFTLPSCYEQELQSYGIQCHRFGPITFSFQFSDYKMLNHRDHRKIAVIDGEVGFTGGLNLADEYINARVRFGVWKDTALMIKGQAVYRLTNTFLKTWAFLSKEWVHFEAQKIPQNHMIREGFIQPFDDSPIDDENVSENVYLTLIQRATTSIFITTPYLIIDDQMMQSLCLAAKSGIDVRLVTPGVPDKKYVYYATQSYYAQLIASGVHIYEYTPGFIHSKMYLCDRQVAIIGSANMDYRSLYLHFENGCVFYGGKMVDKAAEDFQNIFAVSQEITMQDVRKVPFYQWCIQILLRFFAPFM